jgi:hypothetical protein
LSGYSQGCLPQVRNPHFQSMTTSIFPRDFEVASSTVTISELCIRFRPAAESQ